MRPLIRKNLEVILKFPFTVFRKVFLITLIVLAFSWLVIAQDSIETSNRDWKDRAKTGFQTIGDIVVDKSVTGYDKAERKYNEAVNYFKNSTVEGVAKDAVQTVADGAATGLVAANKTWNESKVYFKNNTVADVAEDVVEGAKKVSTGIVEGAKKAWNGLADIFS